ncbi:peptide ABC transporter substrate-binding protein [Candidatus Poribacteria bacterium]|nr:MAG: peptide ABC transporter substrate-binding protein [Candidatus Poribacteria bacterium]
MKLLKHHCRTQRINFRASLSSRCSIVLMILIFFLSCGIPNNPYPKSQQNEEIYYNTFDEEPKHFDPAVSYSSDEYRFIQQIYEPPLQYHYLKRPYELIPLTAEAVPQPQYFDASGKALPQGAPAASVARAVYEVRIRPGIMYQPHPCFAKTENGTLRYHNLTKADVKGFIEIKDFPMTGTRELTAADYVHQIKRMADPRLSCPILSTLQDYILGMKAYSAALANGQTNAPFPGIEVVDRYTYRVILKTKYPQFVYWLAMPFFSPMPEEAIAFYNQPAIKDRNITVDRFPVGTGAYRMDTLIAHKEIVLVKNENFRVERYPSSGEPGDREAGLLDDAWEIIPFIPKVIYKLEKEYIPRWNKFLQGYYDSSSISSDTFDSAVVFNDAGDPSASEALKAKDIVLRTSVQPTTYYLAFNMLDDTVGGYTTEKQKLRQAISIALDYEEFTEIFLNGRGVVSHSPLPPGIFGYESGERGINPYMYDWDADTNRPVRKSIEEARQLLAEAGYPGGQDSKGNPLIISFDNTWNSAGATARLTWMRKKLEQLGITMESRTTDYNRFRDKVKGGNFQFIFWGWHADYPDAENFLFLLYGPNGKVRHDGANSANYDNPAYNQLFEEMKNMENSPERLTRIREMNRLIQRDAPWVFTFHPVSFGLSHQWVKNSKPNALGGGTLKYLRVDANRRSENRQAWNRPVVWPLWMCLGVFILGTIPAVITIWKRERKTQ